MQERQVTLAEQHVSARRPVLGARHAEPGRAGRRLRAARGAARSVLDDAARRLPDGGARSARCSGRTRPDTDRPAACRRRTDVTRLRTFIRDAVFVDDNAHRLHRPAPDAPRDIPRRSAGRISRSCSQPGISPRSYPAHPGAGARDGVHATAGRYARPSDVKEIFLRRDAAPHHARASAREAENIDADASCSASCCARCRSHDPRDGHAGAAPHRSVDRAQDAHGARRSLHEPPARCRASTSTSSSPTGRATTCGASTGTSPRRLDAPLRAADARRARAEHGRSRIDVSRSMELGTSHSLEARDDDAHQRVARCSRRSRARSAPASSRSPTAWLLSRPPRRTRARRWAILEQCWSATAGIGTHGARADGAASLQNAASG